NDVVLDGDPGLLLELLGERQLGGTHPVLVCKHRQGVVPLRKPTTLGRACSRCRCERRPCHCDEQRQREPATVELHLCSLLRPAHELVTPARRSWTNSGIAIPGVEGARTSPSGPTRRSRCTGFDVTRDS